MQFVKYDPRTRKILGRYFMSNPGIGAPFVDLLEIDFKTADSVPELWAEVDVSTRTLRPQPGKIDPR